MCRIITTVFRALPPPKQILKVFNGFTVRLLTVIMVLGKNITVRISDRKIPFLYSVDDIF